MTGTRCGYEIVALDGDAEPCDRPATGWRWYQDVGHEDTLDVACAEHENEGGRRIHVAEAALGRVRATRLMSDLPAETYDRDTVAAILHIQPASVTKYVARGVLPQPAGYLGKSPWWHAATIDTWVASRPAHPKQEGMTMTGWQAFPPRQLTGTGFVYHGYVGRDRPERQCCERDHKKSSTALRCAEFHARRLNEYSFWRA